MQSKLQASFDTAASELETYRAYLFFQLEEERPGRLLEATPAEILKVFVQK